MSEALTMVMVVVQGAHVKCLRIYLTYAASRSHTKDPDDTPTIIIPAVSGSITGSTQSSWCAIESDSAGMSDANHHCRLYPRRRAKKLRRPRRVPRKLPRYFQNPVDHWHSRQLSIH